MDTRTINMFLLLLFVLFIVHKRLITPKGQSQMDNQEKLATQTKKNKNTTQDVLDTTIREQRQTTGGKDKSNIAFML